MNPRFILRVLASGGAELLEPRIGEKVAWISQLGLEAISPALTRTFNPRLREQKEKTLNLKPLSKATMAGDMKALVWRDNSLPVSIGKEIAVLFWAMSNQNPEDFNQILTNWSGLEPEERWWLYTQARASHNNWRDAIRLALSPAVKP